MIGSKRKRKEVYDRMKGQGFSDEDLARIYCPIGLEIVSESTAEIAVSIAAEIVKHFNNIE
jgi:xanthine dehydrogenase accessory factor